MTRKRYKLYSAIRKDLNIHKTTRFFHHLDEAINSFHELGFCTAFLRDTATNKLLMAKTRDLSKIDRLKHDS